MSNHVLSLRIALLVRRFGLTPERARLLAGIAYSVEVPR